MRRRLGQLKRQTLASSRCSALAVTRCCVRNFGSRGDGSWEILGQQFTAMLSGECVGGFLAEDIAVIRACVMRGFCEVNGFMS